MTSCSSTIKLSPSPISGSSALDIEVQYVKNSMKSHDMPGDGGFYGGLTLSTPPNNNVDCSSVKEQQQNHQEKFQALKQRKCDLEKILNEKTFLLEQIQREEQQIMASDTMMLVESNLMKTNSLNFRKKISTSGVKVVNNKGGRGGGICATKERSGSLGDMENKIRQEMIMAAQSHKIPPNIDLDYVKVPSKMLSSQRQYQDMMEQRFPLDIQTVVAAVAVDLSPPNCGQNYPPQSHNSSKVVMDLTKPKLPSGNHLKAASASHSQRGNLTSASITHSNSMLEHNRGRGGGVISSNNYIFAERRNSIRSMQHQQQQRHQQPQQHNIAPSPKPQRQADRLLMIGCYSSGGFAAKPKDSGGYHHMESPKGGSQLDDEQHSIHASGYPLELTVQINDVSPIPNNRLSSISAPGTIAMPSNKSNYESVLRYHEYPPNDYEDSLYIHPRLSTSNIRATAAAQPISEIATARPLRLGSKPAADDNLQILGLGGYWRVLGNERIWCTSHESNSIQQNNSSKQKRPNSSMKTTPVKSMSLGNFDMINDSGGNDEFTDKISLSSLNSEYNKKPKEKQWLETSLDGPFIVTTKHLQQPSIYLESPRTIGGQVQGGGQQLSPIHRIKGHVSSQSASIDEYHQQQGPRRSNNSNLQSQFVDYPPIHKSAAITPHNSGTPPPHSTAPGDTSKSYAEVESLSKPTVGGEPYHQFTFNRTQEHQQHSPIISSRRSPNILQNDLIRIESPRNMTIVQQAVFMPYKEVTKPFEMSDFYKYSTKFRQKDKQAAPPPNQHHVEVE